MDTEPHWRARRAAELIGVLDDDTCTRDHLDGIAALCDVTVVAALDACTNDAAFTVALNIDELTDDELRVLAHNSCDAAAQIASTVERATLPDDLIDTLTRSPHTRVRACAAGHPATSATRALELTDDDDPWVRELAASNRNLCGCTLEQLYSNTTGDEALIGGIASNPNTPRRILEALTHDNGTLESSLIASDAHITLRALDTGELVATPCECSANTPGTHSNDTQPVAR